MSSSELKENDVTKVTFGQVSANAIPVSLLTGQNYINGSGQLIQQSAASILMPVAGVFVDYLNTYPLIIPKMSVAAGTQPTGIGQYGLEVIYDPINWPDISNAKSARFKLTFRGTFGIGNGAQKTRSLNYSAQIKVGSLTAVYTLNQMKTISFTNATGAIGTELVTEFSIGFGGTQIEPGVPIGITLGLGSVNDAGYEQMDVLNGDGLVTLSGGAAVLPTFDYWTCRMEIQPIFT